MKKVLLLLLAVWSFTATAQEKITEGIIVSKQTMKSDNEQTNAQLAMIGDMTTTTYFKGNKSYSQMSNPMAGKTVIIVDNDKKEMLMLLDNPMLGKIYNKKSTVVSEEDLKGLEVTKGTGTKEILGYTCQRYDATMKKDGVSVTMSFYTTDKIDVQMQQTNTFAEKLNGTPLYTESKTTMMGNEITVINEVTEIKKETVDTSKFNMKIPEGYEKAENIPGMK